MLLEKRNKEDKRRNRVKVEKGETGTGRERENAKSCCRFLKLYRLLPNVWDWQKENYRVFYGFKELCYSWVRKTRSVIMKIVQ